MKIIDSHSHFWEFNEHDFGWMEGEFTPLRKDFFPNDFKRICGTCGVDGAIVIQARECLEETDWLLKLSSEHNLIKGVVGWIDLFADDAEKMIKHYSADSALVGLRNVFQGKNASLLQDEQFIENMSLLSEYRLTYDLLITPDHLPEVIVLVDRYPKQMFVVDHLAKPAIAEHETGVWAENMSALAERSNVSAKLSGMLTEGGVGASIPDINFYLDFMRDCFGIDRLMFGGDWPVCTLAGKYERLLTYIKEWLNNDVQEMEAVLSRNAINFYGIKC